MLLLIVFWQILGMGYARTDISVNCGQLMLQGYNSCEITHDDQVAHYTGPEKEAIPGLRFGLITYKCDHVFGYLFSELDCAKCDFECSEEVQVESLNCKDDSAQIWVGAILGLCFAGLIGSFVFKYLYKTLGQSSRFAGQPLRQAYADDTSVHANDEANLKDGTEQAFDQCNVRCSSKDSAGELPGKSASAASTKRKTVLSLLASLLLLKTAKACDVILVMEANNVTMSYEDGKWSGAHPAIPTSFTVQVGQEICIEDHLGGRVSLQVSEIVSRRRYEVVYYTCDFESMDITTVSSSCNNGDSCSKYEGCYDSTFAKLTDKQLKGERPHWFCDEKSDIYDQYSTYPQGCLSMQRRERRGELYPVYKKIGEIGTVKLTVNGTHGSEVIILSGYEPSHQLTGFQLHEVDRIPFMLASIWNDRPLDFVLHYDGKFYNVDASEPHDPRVNLFGDFQVSLDKQMEEYVPLQDVTCQISHHECESCSAPKIDSMIGKLARNKMNLNQPEDFLTWKTNSSIIHTFETGNLGTARLRVANWTLADSIAQEAKCDVDFVASYGCTSCNESAYVVLKSTDIKKEGLIPFRSNCSFDAQFVKCDFEPTKLVLMKNAKTCNIRLPTLNKNILINVTYFKFGHSIKRKSQQNCTVVHTSYGEALEHLVTSDRFVGTFIKTTTLFLVSGLILTVVFRVVQTRQNQSRSERGTNLVDF